MNHNPQPLPAYTAHLAMALITGAGMLGLSAAVPAGAAPTDSYVAIAEGELNDAPPVQAVAGFAANADANSAYQRALTNCSSAGGRQCVVVVSVQSQCIAAAADDFGDFQGGFGPTPDVAYQKALSALQGKQGAKVVKTGCAADVATPPRLGPEVTVNPIIGGLEAHVTDRSGVGSKCTFAMDNISRSFELAVNATYDLKVVPAVPRFKERTVTVTCDNATKTVTTTRF